MSTNIAGNEIFFRATPPLRTFHLKRFRIPANYFFVFSALVSPRMIPPNGVSDQAMRERLVFGLTGHQRRRSNLPGNSQAPGPRGWTIWRETLLLRASTEGDIRTVRSCRASGLSSQVPRQMGIARHLPGANLMTREAFVGHIAI